MEFAPIRDAIYNWFSDQSRVTTIWADGSGPRPGRPYATLKLLTGAVKIGGQDNLRNGPGPSQFTLVGPRRLTVSCNVYGVNAMEILTNVRDSLDDPFVIDQLDADGLAVSDDGEPHDMTEALETYFEPRAQMDVIFELQADRMTEIGPVSKIQVNSIDVGI